MGALKFTCVVAIATLLVACGGGVFVPSSTPAPGPTQPSASPTASPSASAHPTAAPSGTPSATASPHATPTATPAAGPTATPAPTATPQVRPTPSFSPATVNLLGLGPSFAQATSVLAPGYSGALIITATSCAGIATVSPNAGNGPTLSLTITGLSVGTCTATATDSGGRMAVLHVSVTTSTIGVNAVGRRP